MTYDIILDLANNHQGDLSHGKSIIDDLSSVCLFDDMSYLLKFQFRDLDSFIYKGANPDNNKHINRFLQTKLSWSEYEELVNYARSRNFEIMVTPFDEASVKYIKEFGADRVKIASCSADDWPLIEEATTLNIPFVASTGGLPINKVDNLVSFFSHRAVDFSLMHCVGIYPSPRETLNLNRISEFRRRYPEVKIGWSTHEDPNDLAPGAMAAALGATLFERHVGKNTQNYKLNGYSSNKDQVEVWLKELASARDILGDGSSEALPQETESLLTLKRGVYLANDVKKGEKIGSENVYFAFPKSEGQIEPAQFKTGLSLNQDVKVDQPINQSAVIEPDTDGKEKALHIFKSGVHEAKALLNYGGIKLNSEFEVEFSFHHGPSFFRETGAILIDIVNREYCKKLVVVLSGQKHPSHHHKRKEETFQLLYGDLQITVDGKSYDMHPGDTMMVMPGIWHDFQSKNGAVIEEISTTHFSNDSVYEDPSIRSRPLADRKYRVKNWGRYELFDKVL